MNKIMLTIMLGFLLGVTNAQRCDNKECFDGIWVSTEDERYKWIIDDLIILDITHSEESGFYLFLEEIFFLKEGFRDKTNFKYKDVYTKNMDESSGYLEFVSPSDDNIWRTVVKNGESIIHYTPCYNISKIRFSYTSQNESFHLKIEKLPQNTVFEIYKRGQKDKCDYLQWFLHADMRLVTTERAMVYDSTQKTTDKFIASNNLVKIVGEQNGFLQIEYEKTEGEILKGYLKPEDVEQKIDKRKIRAKKTNIFETPEMQTKKYLIEDDIITITGYAGDLLKMEYTTAKGELIKGYVTKGDCWVVGLDKIPVLRDLQ
jgi:hypothetical protein